MCEYMAREIFLLTVESNPTFRFIFGFCQIGRPVHEPAWCHTLTILGPFPPATLQPNKHTPLKLTRIKQSLNKIFAVVVVIVVVVIKP